MSKLKEQYVEGKSVKACWDYYISLESVTVGWSHWQGLARKGIPKARKNVLHNMEQQIVLFCVQIMQNCIDTNGAKCVMAGFRMYNTEGPKLCNDGSEYTKHSWI